MYETRAEPPLSRPRFLRRLSLHVLAAVGLMLGYMFFEHLAWRDAFLNCAMLLGGMGPVDPPKSDGGKLFAGLYALYAGLVFLITAGVMLAPILHRVLHKFHWKHLE
jgi:hypothetical protein